jgi:AAA domain/DnaA N-terminal domain
MSGLPGSGDQLWPQVLDEVARSVSPGRFDTWFPPLRFIALQGNTLQLTAPTETFRQVFLENNFAILGEAAARVIGSAVTLQVAVETPEPSAGTPAAAVPFPVVRAAELETSTQRPCWLIERLWTNQAVGVIGGNPKCGKTTLALEMAVAVASATPCLGTFAVYAAGPAMLYAAEDSSAALRARLETLARLRNLDFERLDVRVISVDVLHLDRHEDQSRLEATVLAHQPAFLVLDPLIRLHNLDENQSGPMAALLGYLRNLQRKSGAAIALVHHAKKNISSGAGAGYTLRGSSDVYAWLDSLLYLRKHQGQLTISAEHRSAPPFGPAALELSQSSNPGTYLKMTSIDMAVPILDTLEDRILDLLANSPEPLTAEALRSRLQVRNQRLVEALRQLSSEGKVQRLANGYMLVKLSR